MATETISMLRHKSHVVVDGPDRAPARSMLRAVGLQDDDFKKPFRGSRKSCERCYTLQCAS